MPEIVRPEGSWLPPKVNEAQREAIMFEGPGPLLVLAGPGSGKTFVITHRVQYLMDETGISPEKILVLTFTREAALSMKERYLNMNSDVKQIDVSQNVKQNSVSRNVKQTNVSRTVNFGTFHSIFYQILKQSTDLQEQRILSDAEKKRFLQPVLEKMLPELSYLERNNLWMELLPAISFFKNAGKVQSVMQRVPLQAKERFQEIYEAYERERRSAGKLDFDDMLTDCKSLLLSDASIRKYWQDRFDHILIDEFQDINPAQYEVMKLLVSPQKNIFAVGDDDQSIYGFRGADPSCMKRFEQEFHAKKVVLNINYRSNEEIVSAASRLISHNKHRFEKIIHSCEWKENSLQGRKLMGIFSGNDSKAVNKRKFEGKKEEKEYLLKLCRDHIEHNNGEKLAILFRTNRNMQRYASFLKQNDVPFFMRDPIRSPFDNEYVKDILAYIRLSHDRKDQESLIRIINKPSRYIKRETMARCLEEWKKSRHLDIVDCLTQYSKDNDMRCFERCQKLKKHLDFLQRLSLYTGIQFIRKAMGYENYLFEEFRNSPDRKEDIREILDWLSSEAEGKTELEELLESKEKAEKSGNFEDDPNGQCITLMTIHGSKGLEFDHVVIPDVNFRMYPHGVMLDEGTMEEERRIFYVAMTRAAKRLDLLYLTGNREEQAQPSIFLKEF